MVYYYTYAHIRPDTGVIFNVGKGKEKRAYSKYDRNLHWHNVVKKNDGKFEVRILNWFNNEDDAYAAEIWQIAELAPLGHLVNKTPGGDAPPVLRGDKNPMRNPDIARKNGLTQRGRKRSPEFIKKVSLGRKGKGTGDRNGMRQPEQKGIFDGLNNSMSKYEHREKYYSDNKTKGPRNGMYGKTGSKNPAYGKPNAMRGKKNLGIAWVAECKTWQHYWGA
jgi:hypothetical protein